MGDTFKDGIEAAVGVLQAAREDGEDTDLRTMIHRVRALTPPPADGDRDAMRQTMYDAAKVIEAETGKSASFADLARALAAAGFRRTA